MQGPRGSRGARGPTGKPGPKVSSKLTIDLCCKSLLMRAMLWGRIKFDIFFHSVLFVVARVLQVVMAPQALPVKEYVSDSCIKPNENEYFCEHFNSAKGYICPKHMYIFTYRLQSELRDSYILQFLSSANFLRWGTNNIVELRENNVYFWPDL